jgi:hypothetical protein
VAKKDDNHVLHKTGGRTFTDVYTSAVKDMSVSATKVKKSLKAQDYVRAAAVKYLGPRVAVAVTENAALSRLAVGTRKVSSPTPFRLKTGNPALVAQGLRKGRVGSTSVKISH